ncbi:MAG: response regulator transcription factor [Sedimentisphaeraceae bacterium JB056]
MQQRKNETVLIVEDDPAMLRGLKDNFEFAGYNVVTASDGEAGLEAAFDNAPNLIILDIMLPKINGYEICRLIRKEKLETPIIMLTAKGQEEDIIFGLKTGADDYVTKPFSIKELLARSEVMLRRQKKEKETVYEFGDYKLKPAAGILEKNNAAIELTPKEFRLLEFFVKNQGRVLTRDSILNTVWGFNVFVTARSVDRCVTTLRNKIENDPHNPCFISTVRGIGYRFK